MSDLTTVTTNFFPTVNEGFQTTITGTVVVNTDTIVPLLSVTGLTNGSVFVGILDPAVSTQATFTGIVDTVGSRITGVKWTRGVSASHNAGVTVLDYVTGTAVNMIAKGLLQEHTQAGRHVMTSPKVITDISDTNGNELLKVTATASAINELTLANAAAAGTPSLTASGGDTNIGLNLVSKGTGEIQLNGVKMSGTWQSWTPTYTNLNIGNGTVTSRYKQIGKVVYYKWLFVWGSTTSLSALAHMSMPVAFVTDSHDATSLGNTASGTGSALGLSTYNWIRGSTNLSSSAGVPMWSSTDIYMNNLFGAMSAGDIVTLHGCYEAS